MFQVCQRKLRKVRKTLGNAKNRNRICLSWTSRPLEMENRPAFSARPAKLRNFLKERVCVMALSITLSIQTPTGRTATTGSTLMFSKWSGHARKIISWKNVCIVFLIPNDVTILLKDSCLHLLSHQCQASQQSHMT